MVTRYRGVRPNNNNNSNNNINNNNHAVLAGLFQPSTLHKLRQLGLNTNTDTPDTAHQLLAEVVAEVAYTRNNARVLNTFKEVMGLLQAARWKTTSGKEIASLGKHGVFNLVPITSVPAGLKVVGTR